MAVAAGGAEAGPINAEQEPLLAPASASRVGRPEAARWWILLWYSYISGLQSLLWFTWSSVPASSKAFLDCGDTTLNLFLNEGPIAFCCTVWLSAWLLVQHNGLQKSVRLGATLCFLASAVRCAPLLLSPEARDRHRAWVLAAVHFGQSLNAAVAPLIVASPSELSLRWFPADERNLATSIANVANAVGRGIGFFLGPALVSTAHDLPRLLYVEIACAFLPFAAVWLYYPANPSVAPSTAAVEQGTGSGTKGRRRSGFRELAADVGQMFSRPSCVAFMVAGGLQMGLYGGWSGVLPLVTPQLSNTQAGTLGSVNTFAGIAGGLLAGWACDLPALCRSLHRVVVLLSLLAFAGFAVVALALEPISLSPFSKLSFPALVAVCGFAGIVRGGVDPLFFELVAETAHPLPAGTSGSALTLFYHLILVVFLSTPASVLKASTLAAMAGAMLLCVLIVLPARVRYVRRSHDSYDP